MACDYRLDPDPPQVVREIGMAILAAEGGILMPSIFKSNYELDMFTWCEYQTGDCISPAPYCCNWIEPGWYGPVCRSAWLCRAHAEEFCEKHGLNMPEEEQ